MDLRQLVRYAVCFVSMVIPVSNAFGAVFVVDTTSDVIDGGDGVTSLREAIQAASTNAAVGDAGAGDANGDIIRFDSTIFAPANNAVITLSNAPGFGDFLVSDDLEIDGVTGGIHSGRCRCHADLRHHHVRSSPDRLGRPRQRGSGGDHGRQ